MIKIQSKWSLNMKAKTKILIYWKNWRKHVRKKEKRMCKFLINNYKKKLKAYIKDNTKLNPQNICNEYIERFYEYMNNADMGNERGRFISYLNIYSGLCAYEILREKGLSENEGIEAYNKMCASMRRLSTVIYKIADTLPNGYNIV